MERIPEQAEKYANNLLPTLVDVAGVENENSELWKELLKIVFFGRLPEGEALHSAYDYGIEVGVQVWCFLNNGLNLTDLSRFNHGLSVVVIVVVSVVVLNMEFSNSVERLIISCTPYYIWIS